MAQQKIAYMRWSDKLQKHVVAAITAIHLLVTLLICIAVIVSCR